MFFSVSRISSNQGPARKSRSVAYLTATLAALMLAGCAQGPGGFGTSAAQQGVPTAQPRPTPDQRGVISFPSFQLVVARMGETTSAIAQRLGIDGPRLARHNAVDPNAPLNSGAVLTLPGGKGGSVQVTDPFAGQGVQAYDIPASAGGQQPEKTSTPATSGATAPNTKPAGADPRQHRVESGETAWSIARKYDVTVNDLASWNGLPDSMIIRPGQLLTIPVVAVTAAADQVVNAPGTGSPTPRPPSAATALPNEKTQPTTKPTPAPNTPDLGATRTAASSSGHFVMPASGPITRAYKKGSNDGIDIQTDAGSAIKAAASGTVAAITHDTGGVPIIVIRHQGELMTVYAGIDALSVSKGDTVTAGQAIGKARGNGMVHFEVRQGFESVDPADYL